jgi:hypothetical protein
MNEAGRLLHDAGNSNCKPTLRLFGEPKAAAVTIQTDFQYEFRDFPKNSAEFSVWA